MFVYGVWGPCRSLRGSRFIYGVIQGVASLTKRAGGMAGFVSWFGFIPNPQLPHPLSRMFSQRPFRDKTQKKHHFLHVTIPLLFLWPEKNPVLFFRAACFNPRLKYVDRGGFGSICQVRGSHGPEPEPSGEAQQADFRCRENPPLCIRQAKVSLGARQANTGGLPGVLD